MKDVRFAEHLAVFTDVARQGSFSATARKRGQTPSAVVRRIDALEASLGVALFIRSTRTLVLTDAGERLLERAQPLLDQLADTHAEVAAFDGAISGTVRIACFPTFGKRYVIPAAELAMVEHPRLRVELDLTERLADPVTERLDAVIRIGPLPDSNLIATKLAEQRRLLVASQAYLDRADVPTVLGDLERHRLIDKLHGADLLGWKDLIGRRVGENTEDAVFRCDDFEAMRLAARAGLGVALLPDWVAGPDVSDGHLTRLAISGEPWNEQPAGIWLLRALAQPSARLHVIIVALRASIGSPPTWVSGLPRIDAT